MSFRAKLAKRLALAHLVMVAALPACGGSDASGPSTVTHIVVSPGSLDIHPQQSFQFAAYGETSGNDSVLVPVRWSTTGGAISEQGFYTATAAGSYDIIATDPAGHRAAAMVTVGGSVSPSSGSVATVEVTPRSTTVAQGSTQSLAGVPRDAAGNVLSGRLISWSSSNAAVALVDGSGLVRGISAGSVVISATSESKTGTAAVTVTPAPTAAECATRRAEWIWCDDFEQDRLSSYFEYNDAGGNFLRTGGAGFNGSFGMRGHWNPGVQSAGALHLAMGKVPSGEYRPVDGGTAKYREIYWRMYVRNQAGWVGGGADKLSRAFVFANGNWAQAAIGHVWSGTSPNPDNDKLMIDPASGTDENGNVVTTGYNDFPHLRWLGSAAGGSPLFDQAHVGQWFCVEAHMRLNDPGSSDGMLELWVNGSLRAQRNGLNYLGEYTDYGINAVYFENYWNAGSVASQDRYFDNIVVSTARIGC